MGTGKEGKATCHFLELILSTIVDSFCAANSPRTQAQMQASELIIRVIAWMNAKDTDDWVADRG